MRSAVEPQGKPTPMKVPETALARLDHEVQQAFQAVLALMFFETIDGASFPPAKMQRWWQTTARFALIESTALHTRAIARFLETDAALVGEQERAFLDRLIGPLQDGPELSWNLRAIEPLMTEAERFYRSIGRRFPEPLWRDELARFGEVMAGSHTTHS